MCYHHAMSLLTEWAKKKATEEPPAQLELGEKVQVCPRLYAVYVEALDELAERFHLSRHALAGELLHLAIAEVGRTVGVEVIPDHEHGGYQVALFAEGRSDEDEASA